MGNIGGTKAKRVNAQFCEVFISTVSNEWLHVQDFDLPIGSPETMEPTTLGSVFSYSGTPRNKFSGTLVYTQDSWADSVSGWTTLMTKTNGERPTFTLLVRFTAADGSTNTQTYTNGAKMEFITPRRGGEGAVKATFSIAIFVDPTLS